MGHLEKLLQNAVDQKIGSGIAAAWGSLDALSANTSSVSQVYAGTTGLISSFGVMPSAVDQNTQFDLSSLTKILATASLFMVLQERGLIDTDATLAHYLPEETKRYPHLAPLTLAQLLSHTSGLPAHDNYFKELILRFGPNLPFVAIEQRKSFFYERILATPLLHASGEKVVYSDMGVLILSYLVEKLFQKDFATLVQEYVWNALPGCDLAYRPVRMDAEGERLRILHRQESVAMTEFCPWRGLLQGQVHDDNCWSMGGVSAHAGVFGSLNAVLAWVRGVFAETAHGRSLVSVKTLRRFLAEVSMPVSSSVSSRRTLGFDMPALDGSGSTGFAFSKNTVGHLGFTGTSLWIDLDRGNFAVLLTNRVHPSRDDNRVRALRRAFHEMLFNRSC